MVVCVLLVDELLHNHGNRSVKCIMTRLRTPGCRHSRPSHGTVRVITIQASKDERATISHARGSTGIGVSAAPIAIP